MKPIIRVLGAAWAVYLVGALLSMPYFNWRFAQEHGFSEWFFFGELVPSAQAFGWPYYAVQSLHSPSHPPWTASEVENAKHFVRSMELDAEGSKVSAGKNPFDLDERMKLDFMRSKVEALAEAQQVDNAVLEKALPGLSAAYRAKFEGGLDRQVRGLMNDDEAAYGVGTVLHNDWVDWRAANDDKIFIPKQPTVR
jgi:hypothetical protein